MKILMVAPPSLHFFRWTDQLKEAGHEVYWFDITGAGERVERINWVRQIVDWRLKYDYPGRYLLKERMRKSYDWLQQFNEKDVAAVFEKLLLEIQPAVVHSFALYVSCTPILEVMKRYKNLKWIYSSWGSDLYYFQNEPIYLEDIKKVLARVNYLFTDCQRDYELAKTFGFNGEFLGVFPGGGGFPLKAMKADCLPFEQRNIILIKGFQGRSGRAIPVLKAIGKIKDTFQDYEIIVFGSDKEVIDYAEASFLSQWDNFSIFGKLPHRKILKLMGKSLIYIGNSNSDGMPNTLLEAICMGVFPIQSNPGGATSEIITDGLNGLLIQDCEDVGEISGKIELALTELNLCEAISFNERKFRNQFSDNEIQNKIIKKYNHIFG